MSGYNINMNEERMYQIIDKHIRWLTGDRPAYLFEEIMSELDGAGYDPEEHEWLTWLPSKSTVSDEQLKVLERKLGYALPDSYKVFLKYKHFYELYISYARFCGHSERDWQDSLPRLAFDGYPRELLIDKGFIPFADWHDWGLLCFDTNHASPGNEYPIVMWDHERWDEFEPFSNSFVALLEKLDYEGRNNGS